MTIDITKLPFDVLLKIFPKLLSSRDLVRLRRCNRKMNDFVEEHRFEISKKNGERDLSIRIYMLHFYDSPMDEKVLNNFCILMKSLKLVTRFLMIINDGKSLSEDELEFVKFINYGSLELNYASEHESSKIFSYDLVQKPGEFDYLKLLLTCEPSPVELVFDCIRKTRTECDLDFEKTKIDFVMEVIRYVLKEVSTGHYETFPKLSLAWVSLFGLNDLCKEMTLLWNDLPSEIRDYCNFDHYAYAKGLKTKILFISGWSENVRDYNLQYLNLFLIDKSKNAFYESLKKYREFDKIDEVILEHLYHSVVSE